MFKSMSKFFGTSFSLVFGGAIAIVLLLLYTSTMFFLVYSVLYGNNHNCPPDCIKPTDGMLFVVTTVGGLVSALVISHLAIASPGEFPISRFVPEDASQDFRNLANVLSALYILVWIATGLVALVVGVMLYPTGAKLTYKPN